MAHVFLILIIGFSLLAGYYLYINDFAIETLDVIFPAIGAILLSLYLGTKSIIIDKPAPKKFGTTIAVLHDTTHGVISGMSPRTLEHFPRMNEFRGARLIDTLPLYNAFQHLQLKETLKKVEANTPNNPANALIENILEYAILEWLKNADLQIGYVSRRTTYLLGAEGGSGSFAPNLNLATIKVPVLNNEPNILLQALPVELKLPKGSKIIRSREGETFFKVSIVTKHSKISFWHEGTTSQGLGEPINEEQKKIYEALKLSSSVSGLGLYGYSLEFETVQFPFARYSEQAKLEAAWLAQIEKQFPRDFSWDRLRTLYVKNVTD